MKFAVRPMLFIAAKTLILSVSLGCEPNSQLKATGAGQSMARSPAAAEALAAEAPSEISVLAAQSQRDVDLLLKSRGRGVQPVNAAEEAGAENPPDPALRRAITWNDPNPAGVLRPPSITAPVSDSPPQAESFAAAFEPVAAAAATKTLEPDRLKSLMVDLSRELYANGSYSSTPLRELLMIAAMSMVDPQRQLDPQAIPDLSDKERELLGKLQAFFAELGQSIAGAGGQKEMEQAIVQAVASLREGLVKPPTLRLSTAALCTRVAGFGDYVMFDKYSFLAQSQQKFIVYLEIDDFTSELNLKNEYVTQIAQQLTIYSDRDGIPVWKEDWQTAVDVTKNKRQDFFTVQVVTLPRALTVGKYQLKVRARDEKSGAEAESSIPFELVADPRLAASVPAGK